jgi:hypothetical protein
MPPLRIDLQDGFQDDSVVIKVNGTEVFRQTGVTTKYQIGVAGGTKVDVDADFALVEVAIPARDLAEVIEVQLAGPVFLGVSLNRDGSLDCRRQDRPFGYL